MSHADGSGSIRIPDEELKEASVMASNNSILGHGPAPTPAPFGHNFPPNYRAPQWRFHAELCPKGVIVKTDAELDKLDAEGWVDHIGKTARLPGLEKIWDAYQAEREAKKDTVPPETYATPKEPGAKSADDELEEQKKADELKAASDKLEAERLERERVEKDGGYKCNIPGCEKLFPTAMSLATHKRMSKDEAHIKAAAESDKEGAE